MEPLLLKIVYLFLVASHVAGAVDYHVYKDTDGDEVLDVPVYPANTTSRPTQKRSTTDSPMCSLNYGLAHVQEAPVNIQHLKDVENVTCAVPVDSCARVSNSNLSSIFVCNYGSTSIRTKCGNLVEPAEKVFSACKICDYYNYGYVEQTILDGTVTSTYYLALGGEFPNSA
ncbi:hypothetical protein CBS115989_10949 [Aspergillus niger]|nr:hypothetical protein CBS115989_10949 [Aspergillus niger]KAI2835315.1 hypothetical protein CBS11232_10536 [Aspergillus niger]KAI2868007.1 hypothetical protein CBS115988_10961 [Aspergillus niger]